MTDKSVVPDDVLGKFARQQHDWFERVRKGSLDSGAVVAAVQAIVDQGQFLKLISGGEDLTIDPVEGTEILAEANDVFAHIDGDFRNWGADEASGPTESTPASVYEQVRDGTFAQLFGSLSGDVSRLCLTQAQIKGFVRKYRQWLRADGYATFFLFKSHDQFFVASVDVGSVSALEVDVYRLGDPLVWYAEN